MIKLININDFRSCLNFMLNIVYEDKNILIVEKPFGIPSQKDYTNDKDMSSIVSDYLKISSIQLIHRLDRPVGGLMVFGKNNETVSKLCNDIRNKKIEKFYLAVVSGNIDNKGILENYIFKNQRTNMSKIVNKNSPSCKFASLEFKKLQSVKTNDYGILNLILIKLDTGRHHQIRVQFSNIGNPIWGDKKYNDDFKRKNKNTNIALWAYKIGLNLNLNTNKLFMLEPPNIFPFNVFDKINP